MKRIPLIAKAFGEHTPESFYAYVKSLLSNKSNSSKEVQGVSITFKSDNTTIRISRDAKAVSRDELALLATEYLKDEMTLLQLFTKRKVGITYEDNDGRRDTDASWLAEDKKRNVKPKRTAGRKNKGVDKLLVAGSDPCVSTEIGILPDPTASS